jgi:hypothetical protein
MSRAPGRPRRTGLHEVDALVRETLADRRGGRVCPDVREGAARVDPNEALLEPTVPDADPVDG